MYFKYLNRNKPTLFKRCWFIPFFIFYFIFIQSCFIYAKEIKKSESSLEIVLGVKFSHNKKKYSTFSMTHSGLEFDFNNKNPVKITTFSSVHTKFVLSTYPEFLNQINPIVNDLVYFKKLTSEIDSYIKKLNIDNINLTFYLVILPSKYGVYYESDTKLIGSKDIDFTFITPISDKALRNPSQEYEAKLLNYFPHELLHYLDVYTKFPKMTSLRSETYASLFGTCIAYNVLPNISDEMVLTFPNYFFNEIQADLNRIRKSTKKDKMPSSATGNVIARYYFQAVSNNRTGENIHSDKIPKFCHKLFSEHNFKYPIEKKPPPWFNEFLQENL
jgi:hypothetical protein